MLAIWCVQKKKRGCVKIILAICYKKDTAAFHAGILFHVGLIDTQKSGAF